MTRTTRLQLSLGLLVGAQLVARTAGATGALEIPDNGSEQMQRGGAWVARASDPEAAFYNPAGLAGQPTALTLQGNLVFDHTCFSRVKAQNDTTPDGFQPGDHYPKVCNNVAPTVNPNFAFNYRASEKLGLAIGVFTPSAPSSTTFPDFVPGSNGTKNPSPARYLLTNFSGTIFSPTIAAGYEVAKGLRIGASFEWTIASMTLGNASMALNEGDSAAAPGLNDVKAQVKVKDLFVPGFTLGTLYSPTSNIDLAGWYHWSAPIDASGDLTAQYPYYSSAVANGNTSSLKNTDTSRSDCGQGNTNNGNPGCGANRAHVEIKVPMEAKLGFRYHQPRRGVEQDKHLRDPMSQDAWDVEADLTYANDAVIDNLKVHLPGDANGNGTILLNGAPPGGVLPPNADSPRNYHDVFGVRVGGDWNVLPDRLAIRAGGYAESAAMSPQYQNVDFPAGPRFGLAFGATYRIHLQKLTAEDTTPLKRAQKTLEITAGYSHSFMVSLTHTGEDGVYAITGIPCNPATNITGAFCPNGGQKSRSNWPVNLGTITNAVNLINLGVTYRF